MWRHKALGVTMTNSTLERRKCKSNQRLQINFISPSNTLWLIIWFQFLGQQHFLSSSRFASEERFRAHYYSNFQHLDLNAKVQRSFSWAGAPGLLCLLTTNTKVRKLSHSEVSKYFDENAGSIVFLNKNSKSAMLLTPIFRSINFLLHCNCKICKIFTTVKVIALHFHPTILLQSLSL